VLSTIPVDGKPSKSENVGRHWHTDLSYTTRPPLGSLFHCHIIPEVGGDTVFANMAAAYDALSDTFKQRIEGLEAVHDYMQVESMKRRDPSLYSNPPTQFGRSGVVNAARVQQLGYVLRGCPPTRHRRRWGKAAWKKPPYKASRGTLYKYIKNVKDASQGCVTDE